MAPTKRTIEETKVAILALETQLKAEKEEREQARNALTGRLGNAFVANEVSAPSFFAPMAPTLMVAGACQNARSLPAGADGGDDRLFCRFTGQTVRALTVTDPQTRASATITAAD